MKFYTYLNEVKKLNYEEVLSKIKQDCSIYLKNIKKCSHDKMLISGRKPEFFFFKDTVRKNRKPKDTSKYWHDYIDRWFYNKYKIKPRSNSLFCTSDPGEADKYGIPFLIFPIGKYKILYNPSVKDLYTEIIQNTEFWDSPNDIKQSKLYREKLLNNYILTKDVCNGLKSSVEIMLLCDSYYAADYGYIDRVKKDLGII